MLSKQIDLLENPAEMTVNEARLMLVKNLALGTSRKTRPPVARPLR